MSLNVFITGATGGIGSGLARVYAAKGATLGLVAHHQDALDRLIASLPGTGHKGYVADVTDRDGIIETAHRFEKEVGPADVVIANAGVSIGVKTQYYEDLAVMDRVYRINVIGMANTFHGFLPAMIERHAGTLVGIGSVAGIRGLPGSEAYCSSKAAVINYCESLRIEMMKHGVKVLTVCPGFVKTPLTSKNPYPMPFILEPDEFARRAVRAIDAHKTYTVIPWQMGLLAKLMKIAPNYLFDRILKGRKQKPRAKELGV